MIALLRSSVPASTEIDVDGRSVSVQVRVNARARHYRLAIAAGGQPILTLPRGGRWAEAEAFLERQRAWLGARLGRYAAEVRLVDGALVPLRGVPHRIVATGALRGTVAVASQADGPALLLPGEPPHHARRLVDWFKLEARRDLVERVAVHARTLEVTVKSVATRSQSTRWGSCSSSGRLNFNWRLVLAPPFVLDYVAAHEVAHLVEMNHSPAFWRTVERTLPEMQRGRAWLKAHGRELMAYGCELRGL